MKNDQQKDQLMKAGLFVRVYSCVFVLKNPADVDALSIIRIRYPYNG
jgi:hypothetical protein